MTRNTRQGSIDLTLGLFEKLKGKLQGGNERRRKEKVRPGNNTLAKLLKAKVVMRE